MKRVVEFYITTNCVLVLQTKYTYVIILFICCLANMIPRNILEFLIYLTGHLKETRG